MSTRQIANAHQELTGNFAACEFEGFTEQLDPFSLTARVVGGEPEGKALVGIPQAQNDPRIGNNRVYFQFIANNPRISQQAADIGIAIYRDFRACS